MTLLSQVNTSFHASQVTQVVEAVSCICITWADPVTLITGSSDHIVRTWRVSREPSRRPGRTRETGTTLVVSHVMRVHSDEVISITASQSWSIIVSGSKDGSAAIWDLNKGVYIRSILHGNEADSSVHLVAVNESTVSNSSFGLFRSATCGC
jgi:WD40 repeat protein